MDRRAIKQAFVLGAGFGTRLRPLTEDLPKPLMPIFQKPLITFALDHLVSVGIESFVINTHHLAAHLETTFADGAYKGYPVRLVHEPQILETGGGIKNAEAYLKDAPFIVYSGDILTDVDLSPLVEEHFRSGNDVTLALRETGLGTSVILENGRIANITRGPNAGGYDYANVSIWNPAIFSKIPPGQKISFIPVLVEWIGQGGRIGGMVLGDREWFNIGSRKEYLEVHRTIAEGKWRPSYVNFPDWPKRIAPDAVVGVGAQIRGSSVVGANCRVGAGAILQDTILWPDSEIASQSELRDCIVRSGRKAEGIRNNIDI